ncbi:MAG: ribulose-phosphate 3-epimerase [Candidatus Bathyarchaeota archaeon]|nr:ribulose-phosphate 3-epimerase [Candidatus Bathyarchaeota archaeon]
METLIVPAIIAKTQRELEGMLCRVSGNARRIMLDVMDGEFVPGNSLNFDFKLSSGLEYEAHLMVEGPLDWVREKADDVDIAIMQVETLENIKAAVDYVKGRGLRVTLALNPETELDAVLPYLREVHGILIMTVSPGRYGGQFLPETLEKVRRLREIDGAIPIEVDGGMNPENARLARDAGANTFASGSYILKSGDTEKAIKELKDAVS